MACGSSTAKSHDLCTVIFLYTLIYDRIQEKYDDLRPYTTGSVTVDLGGESRTNAKGEIGQLCELILHATANSTGRTEFCHGKATVS
jgi:hypothetical protein